MYIHTYRHICIYIYIYIYINLRNDVIAFEKSTHIILRIHTQTSPYYISTQVSSVLDLLKSLLEVRSGHHTTHTTHIILRIHT